MFSEIGASSKCSQKLVQEQYLHCHIRTHQLVHNQDYQYSASLQSEHHLFVALVANYDEEWLHHLGYEFST
jgi:hypothetical protein